MEQGQERHTGRKKRREVRRAARTKRREARHAGRAGRREAAKSDKLYMKGDTTKQKVGRGIHLVTNGATGRGTRCAYRF